MPTSVFGVVVHDYSPGIAKWLRDAAVSFQAGDLLVGIGDDDVRGWPTSLPTLRNLGQRGVEI